MDAPSTSTESAVAHDLPLEAMPQVAAYFQALAEPVRLRLLNALRSGERSVGELAQDVACSNANASRHLALLAQNGLVEREARGNSVYYRIADASVYALCDLVCGSLARRYAATEPQRAALIRNAL